MNYFFYRLVINKSGNIFFKELFFFRIFLSKLNGEESNIYKLFFFRKKSYPKTGTYLQNLLKLHGIINLNYKALIKSLVT